MNEYVKAKEYIAQLDPKNTGSSDMQVALLTGKIAHLTQHLNIHKKDYSTRLGLLKMAAHRRRLLRYIKNKDLQHYSDLIHSLGIRK